MNLPADALKLDRSFLVNAEQSVTGQHIIRTIQRLGHDLHLDVVAEGVETPQQHALLLELGCQQQQGYLLARPMPAPQLDAWLQENAPQQPPQKTAATAR